MGKSSSVSGSHEISRSMTRSSASNHHHPDGISIYPKTLLISDHSPLDCKESDPLLRSCEVSIPTIRTGANWVMTSFLIVNTALGIGLLNFPAAYNQAGGISCATVLQVVLLFLMISTMLILAYCSDFNEDKTYHDVLLTMCGKRAQQLAAASITCTLYCVCTASLIIIGDQIDNIFASIYGPQFCHSWYLERHFTIPLISIVFILPLCYCKSVDFLGYIGAVGIFAMLYPVFLTIYGYVELKDKPDDIKTRPDDLAAMLAVMPVLGLGYQCQEVVVPIYACMKERNLWQFSKASILAMLILFVLYSITGGFGYLTFGAHVSHNVMKMFEATDPIVMIGVAALIVKMIATYPMLALCGRDAVAGLYAELVGLTRKQFQDTEKGRRCVVASIWFGSSLLLATITGGIGVVIRYLGCVASVNIYVYPGICLMQVVTKNDPNYQSRKSKLLLALAIFIVGFGVFSVVVILVQSLVTTGSQVDGPLCV